MSTITSAKNKATALTHVQALIAGTQDQFPNGQFTLANTAYTAAHASVTDGLAALRATETKAVPLIRAYTSFLRATFSTATAQLGEFGLQAPKAHLPLPTAKRAAATAKLRATRAARGTTSKKQKLAIKGDVTGVTVTPITTPAPASPPATPAGPAPVATTPVATPK